MVKILVKKFDKNIKLPAYKTSGSSGMDLMAYIKNKITINPGKTAMVPTGIAIAVPILHRFKSCNHNDASQNQFSRKELLGVLLHEIGSIECLVAKLPAPHRNCLAHDAGISLG